MTSLLTSKLAEIKKRSEATTYDGQILLVQLKADIPRLLKVIEILIDQRADIMGYEYSPEDDAALLAVLEGE